MTQALTESVWLKALERVVSGPVNDTTRTLAQVLIEIIFACDDPEIGLILDTWASRLLEPLP